MKSDFMKQFSQYVHDTNRLEQYYYHLNLYRLPTLIASEYMLSLSCERTDFRVLLNTTDHQEAHEIYERVFDFYKEEIE